MMAANGETPAANTSSAPPNNTLTTVSMLRSVAPLTGREISPTISALERRFATSKISRENAHRRTPPSHSAMARFSSTTPQPTLRAESRAAAAAMMASVAGHRATAILTVNDHVSAKTSSAPSHTGLPVDVLRPGF